MPTWEHEGNCQGGRIIISVYRKDLVPYMWEVLVCFLLGVHP